jgi:hypothetical protein
MISVTKKYVSRFELINTSVLVNSGFLLERDTQAYNICHKYNVRARIRARVKSHKDKSFKIIFPGHFFDRSKRNTGIFSSAKTMSNKVYRPGFSRPDRRCLAPLRGETATHPHPNVIPFRGRNPFTATNQKNDAPDEIRKRISIISYLLKHKMPMEKVSMNK